MAPHDNLSDMWNINRLIIVQFFQNPIQKVIDKLEFYNTYIYMYIIILECRIEHFKNLNLQD